MLPFFAVILIILGLSGHVHQIQSLKNHDVVFVLSGFLMLGYSILRMTYIHADKEWDYTENKPVRLKPGFSDYVKALICWFDSYRRTYATKPGLYFTGDNYDPQSPILVTANYHLTVFSILRNLKSFNVRLLVIDSDGINVWCAAGKGRFSNREIYKQLFRYGEYISPTGGKINLILPKLAFSGVSMSDLKKAGISVIVGPVYARDIRDYLENPPYTDRIKDRIEFKLPERFFTCIPGLLQCMYQVFLVFIGLWILELIFSIKSTYWIFPLVAIIAFLYPILFPWIPGSRFAVKGLVLSIFLILVGFVLSYTGVLRINPDYSAISFCLATGLFFGLAYTGNSPVSNYSRVRKEIAGFLPLTLLLYVISLVSYIVKRVN